MIINLLTQKKWNLSGFGFEQDPKLTSGLGFKDVGLGKLSSCPITTDQSHVSFVFSSEKLNKLSYIEYDFSIGSYDNLIMYYSQDGTNWFEFPFKSYVAPTFDESIVNNGIYRHYSTSVTGSVPDQDFVGFENGIDNAITLKGPLLNYIFQTEDPFSKETINLCEGINFQHIRIDIWNVSASLGTPFYINGLRIFVEEEFVDEVLDADLLVMRAENYFNSRTYEEQPFMQEISKTFLEMFVSPNATPTKKNPNNFYTKSLGLDSKMFFEDLILGDNDFSFNSVKYNTVSKKYEQSFEVYNANNKIFQDLSIREYALDYKNLVDKLEHDAAMQTVDWVWFKKHFVLFLLKHVNLLNHMKGSRFLVEYIINLYSEFFGYNIISVVEDRNFVYRISSSIPTEDWTSLLKAIVHPCGWDVIYNEIDSSTELQIETGPINHMNGKYLKGLGAIDCVNYFEGDILNRPRNVKKMSFLRCSNLPDTIIIGVDNHPIANKYRFRTKYDESKLKVNYAWEEKATYYVDYSSPVSGIDPINEEMYHGKNYIFCHDRLNNTYTTRFGQTGVAIKYSWETFLGNKLVNKEFTPFENYFFDLKKQPEYFPFQTGLKVLPTNKCFRQVLKLEHQGWSQTLFEYNYNFELFRALPPIFSWHNQRYKMLNVHTGNAKGTSHHSISFNSLNSEYLHPSTGITNDVYHSFTSSSVSAEFWSTDFISKSQVAHDSVVDITLKYKKPGLFTKYVWDLYLNGTKIRTIERYFNDVSFTVNDIPGLTVALTLIKDDFRYTLQTLSLV